jgi:asparagine N-glycosylation enzyme membrane subunit Stt3
MEENYHLGESAKTHVDHSDLLAKRKEALLKLFSKGNLWVIALLIIAVILGVYIRSMPMHDHNGHPGLWDITTNTWTLGPDLDPWVFLRTAKYIIHEGGIPEIDSMRYVPLGVETAKETRLLPYMISWTYYLSKPFYSEANVEFAGALLPVIAFALTIVAFFFFVREIFRKESKEEKLRANIIAIIATFLMIVTPVFLSRTVAGIPEKESVGFFFMFIAMFLFLRAWKSERLKASIIFATLAGIATALMHLIWGGVMFIYITIAGATFLAFLLGRVRKRELIIYTIWIILAFSIFLMFTKRATLINLLISLSTAPAVLVFIILIIDFILWKTALSKKLDGFNKKVPNTVISLILSLILILVLASILFGPSFVIERLQDIHQTIFKPVTGRWNTTVAENRQPNFKEWSQNFGPFIKNIPIMFWLFFIGSTVLFKKVLNKIKKKDAWILTGLYVLFLCGMIFSRYSPTSIFNGDNFISKAFYYGTALLLIGYLIYYYQKYYKEGHEGFKKIEYSYLLILTLFILSVFSARGAVRLIMVLGAVAPIPVSFLIVESLFSFRKAKDEASKILLGTFTAIIIIASIFAFVAFYQVITVQAYNFIPSSYNQQWQKAMDWARDETPKESVFAHWWDYGYWVQSIGERATVLDGGNFITFWNYWMGRLVLTGDNQKDALEFLYNHQATHLLIDPTDIGKYGAFSSIGSNADYDRFSWMGAFLLDERQTRETNNQTLLVYPGGSALDEDLIIENGSVLLPKQKAGIAAVVVPIVEGLNGTTEFGQPYAIMFYQGQQYHVNMRYLSLNGEKFMSFNDGIEACAYIFPSLVTEGTGLRNKPLGAVLYLSPRVMRGFLVQKYILNDPFDNFPNFKLVHSEQSIIVSHFESQGLNLPDFVYYRGIQGPIKIWEIEYTGEERTREEYLDRDSSKYLDWKL